MKHLVLLIGMLLCFSILFMTVPVMADESYTAEGTTLVVDHSTGAYAVFDSVVNSFDERYCDETEVFGLSENTIVLPFGHNDTQNFIKENIQNQIMQNGDVAEPSEVAHNLICPLKI